MGKNDDQSHQDRWARLRFAIVGPMLAAPPATGELRPALKALSTKVWRHPISGLDVRFGASTIERWYYSARAAPLDPVSVLRQQVRSDSGRFRSLTSLAMDTLDAQYRKCPHWTVQQHLHNLCIALTDSHSPSPSYASIRRYFEARGMSRQTQQHRSSSVDARKRWHEWILGLTQKVAPERGNNLLLRTC